MATGLEPFIQGAVLLGGFVFVAIWETLAPRRRPAAPRLRRWTGNLALSIINAIGLRIFFPLAALGGAMFAESRGWGLFQLIPAPESIAILASIVALDFVIYCQHRLMHAAPWLWRLHRVHHADTEFDVSTGVRFHPVEILLSMSIKIGAVIALGAPAEAVIAFELLLSASSIFNHANVKLPDAADRVLRLLIVTPDMHRIHHSRRPEETNSNFCFFIPWWDRLLGTYRAQPADGYQSLDFGLEYFRKPDEQRLIRMLLQPARSSGV